MCFVESVLSLVEVLALPVLNTKTRSVRKEKVVALSKIFIIAMKA